MSSTDDRIVKMQFDNAQFKRGAAESQKSLTDLDRTIETAGKGRGLLSLSGAMQRVSVSATTMTTIVTTAIANITNKAINAGTNLAKGLTLDPIKQGFQEYESLLTKQNVIMNATGKSATEVKKVLTELNEYSDKTIYNFGSMTSAVQKFVNAGVDLDVAVQTIKGIGNAAAFAGASTEEADRAMYAFAQSMSLGFIQLQDWNQIENANLGTQKFKNELLKAGVAAGTLRKQGKGYVTESGKFVSATKGWRDGLQEQWATTEVLNKALGKYADNQTTLGKKAFKAAQEVRTFSAFMSTLKEGLGSGWANIFTALVGGLDESTKMWTNLSNTVGKAAHDFFNFATTAILTFKSLGGMGKVMQTVQNIAAPFLALFRAIGDAWQEAFPTTGKGAGGVLYSIADGFEKLTSPLQTVATWMAKLTPVFAFFFKAIKMGAGGLSQIASDIAGLASSLSELFTLKPPSGRLGISEFFSAIFDGIGNLYQKGMDAARALIDGIVAGFDGGSIDTAGTVIGTGLLAGIYLALKKGINFNWGEGLLGNINVFEQLTSTLKTMQTSLQAKTLTSIAIAVGILAASMVALSFVKGEDLAKSLAAISVGMGQLLVGMAILTKIGGSTGFVTLPIIAAGMVLLATSIAILTGAIALMGQLKWETIGKGLTGIAGALAVIGLGMKLMPLSLPITAAGLVLVSVALNAIAGAIAIMGNLEWETIGKGLVTTAGALVIIAGAMQLMPLSLPVTAAGLVLVGIALNGIATALKIMGTMSWEDIAQGLVALGGAIAILAVGLNAMNGTLLGSAAMLVAATAINVLVPALLIMSKMSWEGIAKSMVALAGGMIILGLAMAGMSAAIPGALALLIVAPAILLLSTALVALSTLSWEDIAQALVALAAGLTVIGIAGLLIGPVVPALLGLGAALLLMGAGLALAGVGILAFSTGLAALVAMGAGAISYLSDFIMGFIALMPELGAGFGLLITEFVKVITEKTPIFIAAAVEMITGLIDAAKELVPKLGPLISTMITTGLNIIKRAIPQFTNAGADVITGVLRGLANRIPRMADAAGDAIVAFIRGVAAQSGKIADAAAKAMIKFINALSKAIDDNSAKMGEAMGRLGVAMVKGLIKGITGMAGEAIGAVKDLAGGLVNAGKNFLGIKSPSKIFAEIGYFLVKGLTNGIQNNAASAITAVATMVGGQIGVANELVSKYIQDLDQQSIAARAKADGLAAAAKRAQQLANQTKTKKDDKAADKISKSATAADKAADAAEKKAASAKAAQDRVKRFQEADTLGKAQIESEYAQGHLESAKAYEQRAAKSLAQAAALAKQANAKGVTNKQEKALKKEAAALRKQAAADAVKANQQLEYAKLSAGKALAFQTQAGAEAAAAFQKAFTDEAKADADDKAFAKLSDVEKAAQRKKQADELQKKANADLEAAKKLAYTDLAGANKLAEQARNEAEQARKYLDEAANYAKTGVGASVPSGTVVNLKATDAASKAMSDYSNLYDSSRAAAAGDRTVEFNQYNTSPESLSPSEIYRQSNNLFAYAVEKIDDAAA